MENKEECLADDKNWECPDEEVNNKAEGEITRLTTKCALLENNLKSAYEKIRFLESTRDSKEILERNADALILQAISVFSNTVSLAIKNKNNN